MFPVSSSVQGFIGAYCASSQASATDRLEVAYQIANNSIIYHFLRPSERPFYRGPIYVPIGIFDHPISDQTLYYLFANAVSNYHAPAGDVLQIWRGRRSRQKVADDLGIPVRTLEAYEQSRRSLMDASFSTVTAFVRYYGLTYDHIIALYAGASSVDSGLDA